MAIIKQGPYGGYSGKAGNLVGASWKGINYIRVMPASVANPRTPGQVNQRNKFSAVQDFVNLNLNFIKVGYKFMANKMTAANAAQSYLLKNAITGTAPEFSVDPATALVSHGKLQGVMNGTASVNTGELTVNWQDNSARGNALATDQALLLVYNPTKAESIEVLQDAVQRSAGTMELVLPGDFTGDTVHVYLAFKAADASKVSNSSYLGAVAVV